MRKGEANTLDWRDLDFEAGEIVARGDAETGRKNWELRRVPLIPDARTLFERMRRERVVLVLALLVAAVAAEAPRASRASTLVVRAMLVRNARAA